ncbi:MAG TPA: glycosyltransferase family protein [Candidatus Magasanikbacteria bacterium]|nr:glycosyltransferase family protein [Candidatus Magasanikbacteria bacterium]
MSRIIYGLAGEGMGHASRSKILIEHLLSQGHEVKVISHDKGYENLSPYFEVLKISGLRITYEHNQVRYLETVFDNILKLPGLQKSFNKILKLKNEFQPQLIISDFEPLTALLAHWEGIPLISVDNQHQLIYTNVSYPKEYLQEALAAKTVSRLMVSRAEAYLITSFFKTRIKHRHTYLFPPILRREVLEEKPVAGDYVLVYTTSHFSDLNETLEKIKTEKFIVYGLGEKKSKENVFFKAPSQDGFLKDLAGCKAIIATAGLSLISEALYLGKPYLAIPVKKQFEQILNAHYLEKCGYGKFLQSINQKDIELFLSNLVKYRKNLLQYPKEDNKKIFSKLDSLIKRYTLNS